MNGIKSYFFSRYTLIPINSRILYIGCESGDLLDVLQPEYGCGIVDSPELLAQARKKYPQYTFYSSLSELNDDECFDVILIAPRVIGTSRDIQLLLALLQCRCHERTRVFFNWYVWGWRPLWIAAHGLRLLDNFEYKNWLYSSDINTIIQLAGYEVVTVEKALVFPWYVPVISWFINTLCGVVPLLKSLGLLRCAVLGPIRKTNQKSLSVSVIIPCRNERGNIERAVQEVPAMGCWTELIFVEGNSKDGTLEELYRVQKAYPDKTIQVMVQPGKGKWDAVAMGFAAAHGDILMILDADLTVPPQDLPKFYHALASGQGEFINGSRLVYRMESQAMPWLNFWVNHCFAVLFSWLIGQRLTDTLCGTKVLYKKDYERIRREQNFFGTLDPFGDFDLLFGAARLQLKIVNVPIRYKNRTYGSTQIRRFYHGWLLIRLWLYAAWKLKSR